VTIRTDTSEEQFDAAVLFDFLLIASALCHEILCVTVEDVYVLRTDIDVREEVLPHKGVVALRVILWNTYILIHIEGHYVTEAHFTLLVEFDEVAVHTER
jgi:hypothetical protein